MFQYFQENIKPIKRSMQGLQLVSSEGPNMCMILVIRRASHGFNSIYNQSKVSHDIRILSQEHPTFRILGSRLKN